MSYTKLLKEVRQHLDESQKVFAHRFGVTQATVSSWETGGTQVPFRVLHFCFGMLQIDKYDEKTLIQEAQFRLTNMAQKEAARKAPSATILTFPNDDSMGYERESLIEQVETKLGYNQSLRIQASDFHHIRDWNRLGYMVKKGEKAYKVVIVKQLENGVMIRTKGSVFHVSQVIPKEEFYATYGYSPRRYRSYRRY